MPSIVSIIIPLYNRLALISETLSSIRAQTYPYWEAIIVDDGSTDGSYERVQVIAREDARIKVQERDRLPKGASVCRNIGLHRALGKYVIFLDSDDLLAPTCLEHRVAILDQYPDIDFAVFNMLLFREALNDTNIVWNIDSEEDDLIRFLRIDGVWSITGPMHRKDSLLAIGGFNETLPFWQDFEFHIRAICQGLCYRKYLHEPPDCYNRRHDSVSISQRGFRTEEQQRIRIRIYQDIVQQVKAQRLLNQRTGAAIVLFLFNQSRSLVIDHGNLSAALSAWAYAYEVGAMNKTYAQVGRWHLRLTHRHQQLNTKVSVWLFLAKFIALLLPRKYKQANNTLCKVKLQNA